MTQSDEPEQGPNPVDRRLWQRCRMMDADEDEAARFLDLAAFADGLLDIEERERVAALLAADPEAAADVLFLFLLFLSLQLKKLPKILLSPQISSFF